MADRSSAYLFATIFELIDEFVPKPVQREVALRYWKNSHEYDFSNYQMGCDETLISLGLAKKGVDPDYPDDGETTLYAESDGSFR